MKKQGYGGKGSWGSTSDEIRDARQLVEDGEFPPISSPEREKSMRKLSISSSTSSEASTNGNASLNNANQSDKILEEGDEWVDEPDSNLKEEGSVAASTSKA